MARLIRKQTTHYHADGKRVPAGTPGAARVVVQSRKWYAAGVPGWPAGKSVPLATDKRVAERMLAELVRKAELGSAGMRDTKPGQVELDPLVTEFGETLARVGNPSHVAEVTRNVRRVLAGCRLRTVADLLAPDVAARVESFVWKLPGSSRTAHGVGKHARQFTRWLWRKKRELDHDPLAGMDLPSPGPTRKRRPLTADELTKLVTGMETADWHDPRIALTTPDRVAVYLLAATTGLRAAEIASLTVDDFRPDDDVPTVRLAAEHAKNGQESVLPLSPVALDKLRPILAARSGVVWPGRWFRKAAEMLWRDMATVGLPIQTPAGRADFHSLRHTFITLLGQGNASAKAVQNLARHSTPVLTIGRYSHADLTEQHAAVAALPLGGGVRVSEKDALLAVLVSLFASLFAPDLRTDTDSDELRRTDEHQPGSDQQDQKRKKS
jgi:integrase/recombinase XerD